MGRSLWKWIMLWYSPYILKARIQALRCSSGQPITVSLTVCLTVTSPLLQTAAEQTETMSPGDYVSCFRAGNRATWQPGNSPAWKCPPHSSLCKRNLIWAFCTELHQGVIISLEMQDSVHCPLLWNMNTQFWFLAPFSPSSFHEGMCTQIRLCNILRMVMCFLG